MTAPNVVPFNRADDRHKIFIGSEADAIRTITKEINGKCLKGVYVTRGELIHLSEVSGDPAADGDDEKHPLPVEPGVITPHGLAAQLAFQTCTYTERVKGKGENQQVYDEEITPPARTLSAILSQRQWPGVDPLVGVVGAPVLRRNGTLLQTPGYDRATRLYLAPKLAIEPVAEKPTRGEVAEAREFLLDHVLRDFPWVTPADRANYVGLLVANILRPYFRCLTPFGFISATTQGAGKSFLSNIIGSLFGLKYQPFTRNDSELRKAITSLLDQPARVIVLDNIKEGDSLDSPILAQLLTAEEWSDRLLGTNAIQTRSNDRLWLANGNNIRLGGDMATRSVLVRIRPNAPKPEERTGFAIADLDGWLKNPANRARLLRSLLVLVMDWFAAGHPHTDHRMRQFSGWAQATGGFLAHHGIAGFLDNAKEVRAMDDEDAMWVVFLSRWYELFGEKDMTAQQVLQSAQVDFAPGTGMVDRWQGDFVSVDENGALPKSALSLGKYLGGQEDRFHDEYVLKKRTDTRKKVWWRVERIEQAAA